MTARNIDKRTDNIVIGAGEVYLDLHEGGAPTGERFLGDAVGAALEITTEETAVFSGSGPVARELARIARSVTRTVTLTLTSPWPSPAANRSTGASASRST